VRIRDVVAAIVLLAASASAESREVRGAAAGDFDLYVLALSWSPGFCASGGAERAPDQCSASSTLGFVVHGLWPQYERGYPAFCGPAGRSPRSADMDAVEDVMPSRGLARYQWRKHGSCSGMAPSDYFRSVAAAFRKVQVPQVMLAPPDRSVAPLDLERAFADANPGLRTDMISVGCGRNGGVLQEIRVCLTRDLRSFRPCPDEVERSTCRVREVVVPGVR
jgi:ribonuclease T2